MIRFGTAGWRGVIGDEFTFRNVRLVAQAIADSIEPASTVIVGHDTRFLSERFAVEAARVLSGGGHRVLGTARDIPSPVLAFSVAREGAGIGLTITGSHCPPEYNGLKLYRAGGVPAPASLTDRIEARTRELEEGFVDRYRGGSSVDTIDPTDAYLAALAERIDLEAIASSGLRVAVDPLHGTAHEILDRLLVESGCACEVLHNFRDTYQSGYSPAFSRRALTPLQSRVAGSECALGLATDTDADRFAVIDADGTLLEASDVHALLLDYLATERGERRPVVRSVAGSELLERVAAELDLPVERTKVGFRHLAPRLANGEAGTGFEENAGFGWARHLPDKDGILAGLLVAEIAARSGRPLRERISELHERVGRSVYLQRDYPLDEALEERLASRAAAEPPEKLGGRTVRTIETIDGFKLHFGDSWFLYRRSGTRPVLRCYAEAPTREDAEALHEAGRRFLFEIP